MKTVASCQTSLFFTLIIIFFVKVHFSKRLGVFVALIEIPERLGGRHFPIKIKNPGKQGNPR